MFLDNVYQLLQMPLFYNHSLLAGNNNFYTQLFYDKGFRFVKDILYQQGDFLELDYLEQIIGKKINFLQYHSLKLAIKKYIQSLNIWSHDNLLIGQYPILICLIKPM